MYTNVHYASERVRDNVSIQIQELIWNLVKEYQMQEKESFSKVQIFEFSISNKGENLMLIYRESSLNYSKTYCYRLEKPINNFTIWVIDNGEYLAML